MAAYGCNSISNCVRAARTGNEEASIFAESQEDEPAPLDAKGLALLQSLRANTPHLQRKAATTNKSAAVAEEEAATSRAAAAPTQVRRRDPPATKKFASAAEKRKAKKQAKAPPPAQDAEAEAPSETKSKRAKTGILKTSILRTVPSGSPDVQPKRKAVVAAADAPQPKRRAVQAAGADAAPSKPSRPAKRAQPAAVGDALQAALEAADGDSGAAGRAPPEAAFTPGCVLKILQPKVAKGADGKYPRGHMAALKEKLGGEAGGVLYAHIVPAPRLTVSKCTT